MQVLLLNLKNHVTFLSGIYRIILIIDKIQFINNEIINKFKKGITPGVVSF